MKLVIAENEGNCRLDRFLAARFPELSRALVMKYLKEGRARLNGMKARPGVYVESGDDLLLPDFEESLERIRGGQAAGLPDVAPRAEPEGIFVVFQDDDIVVVDKPAGLVMHPGKGHEDEGLDMLLREHFGPSTRLVHRIDRDTSGVVVAARGHPDAARRLAEEFKRGDVEKTYVALLRGHLDPPEGVIDLPLHNTRREGQSVRVKPEGKPAQTAYKTLETFPGFSWVEVHPKTGRRHQIRAHFAHVGCPLAVDHVYAKKGRLFLRDIRPDLPRTWKNPVVLSRQPLHAAEITFRHPKTGQDVTFGAPPPEDLLEALRLLREAESVPE